MCCGVVLLYVSSMMCIYFGVAFFCETLKGRVTRGFYCTHGVKGQSITPVANCFRLA